LAWVLGVLGDSSRGMEWEENELDLTLDTNRAKPHEWHLRPGDRAHLFQFTEHLRQTRRKPQFYCNKAALTRPVFGMNGPHSRLFHVQMSH